MRGNSARVLNNLEHHFIEFSKDNFIEFEQIYYKDQRFLQRFHFSKKLNLIFLWYNNQGIPGAVMILHGFHDRITDKFLAQL